MTQKNILTLYGTHPFRIFKLSFFGFHYLPYGDFFGKKNYKIDLSQTVQILKF